jgi:hypothetical protein
VTTYTDVAVALGRPISDTDEQAQVTWWITTAELQIQSRLGDLSALDQDVLKYVVVEAVAAKAQNPEGASSETIDDYTYRLPTETRRVTILDEWWQMLDPNTSAGAYSTRPGFEPDTYDPLAGWA